jgi:hypothetical protein
VETQTQSKSKEAVFYEITEIADRYTGGSVDGMRLSSIDSFEKLSEYLSVYLGKSKRAIQLFTVEEEKVVHCWLGDLVDASSGQEMVWEREVFYTSGVFDRLQINDYRSYLTGGQDAYEAGSREGKIYINRSAYRKKAEEMWDFLTRADSGELRRRYDPLKSNKLRKRLKVRAWRSLYQDSLDIFSHTDGAKDHFVDQFIKLKRDLSFYHELGHLRADLINPKLDPVQEEIVAILTELFYGSNVYDSLDFLVSMAWANDMGTYKKAGRSILKSWVRGPIHKGKLSEQIQFLDQLTVLQIRQISERSYRILLQSVTTESPS